MASVSNLADAMRLLDRCTDDELRQIQAVIAVRLKETPSNTRRAPKGGKGGSQGSKAKAKPSRKSSQKGNPQRKSQYETHPLYKVYKDAKAAMEAAAKRDKVPFSQVTGETRDRFDSALTQWVEAKHSFRSYQERSEAPAERPSEDKVSSPAEADAEMGDEESSSRNRGNDREVIAASGAQRASGAETSRKRRPSNASSTAGSHRAESADGDVEIAETAIVNFDSPPRSLNKRKKKTRKQRESPASASNRAD